MRLRARNAHPSPRAAVFKSLSNFQIFCHMCVPRNAHPIELGSVGAAFLPGDYPSGSFARNRVEEPFSTPDRPLPRGQFSA